MQRWLVVVGTALSAIILCAIVFRADSSHGHAISVSITHTIRQHLLAIAVGSIVALVTLIAFTIWANATRLNSRMVPRDTLTLGPNTLNASNRSYREFIDEVLELHKSAKTRFSDKTQHIARLSLEYPMQVSPRGSLIVDMDSSCVSFDTVRRIDYPALHAGKEAPEIVVCIARYRKDRMLQHLEVSVNGDKWTTIHSDEGKALCISIVEANYSGLKKSSESDKALLPALELVLSDNYLLPDEAARFSTTKIPVSPRDVLSFLRKALKDAGNPSADVSRFMRLVEDMCLFRPIWLSLGSRDSPPWSEIGATRWTRVECKYSLPIPASRTFVEQIRTLVFGLAPREVVLPLYGALESRSWHLSYVLREGCYVYAAGIVPHPSEHLRWRTSRGYDRIKAMRAGMTTADRVKRIPRPWEDSESRGRRAVDEFRIEWVGNIQPQARLSGVGSSQVNVYLRDCANIVVRSARKKVTLPTIPTLYVDTRERPPGILLPIIAVAAYSLIVSLLVAFWPPDFSRGITDRWWAVTVFGLPPIISAWVLSQLRRTVFDRASLIVVVCGVWGIVNPLLLMLACFTNVARGGPFVLSEGIPGVIPRFLQLNDVLVALVTFSSLLNVLLCAALLVSRATRYISVTRTARRSRWVSRL